MTPTARTLQRLRSDGWLCQVVERWCPHSRRRIDLFQIIDVLAVRDNATLGVQATTMTHRADHLAKIKTAPGAAAWLKGGVRQLQLWAWRRLKTRRGGKAIRWTPAITAITEGDLGSEAASDCVPPEAGKAGTPPGGGLHFHGFSSYIRRSRRNKCGDVPGSAKILRAEK